MYAPLLGLPEKRIDEALATVSLADTGSQHAGRFSMGMKQRLGIALAHNLKTPLTLRPTEPIPLAPDQAFPQTNPFSHASLSAQQVNQKTSR